MLRRPAAAAAEDATGEDWDLEDVRGNEAAAA